MLAPGILLRAGQSSPLAVIETPGWWSCACDPRAITCGAQDIRSGLQRSLMTGGQRVGGPDTDRVDGVSTATRLPGPGSRSPTCGDAASHPDSTAAARLLPDD